MIGAFVLCALSALCGTGCSRPALWQHWSDPEPVYCEPGCHLADAINDCDDFRTFLYHPGLDCSGFRKSAWHRCFYAGRHGF